MNSHSTLCISMLSGILWIFPVLSFSQPRPLPIPVNDSLIFNEELRRRGFSEQTYGFRLTENKDTFKKFEFDSGEGLGLLFLWSDSIYEYEGRIDIDSRYYSIGNWMVENDTLHLSFNPWIKWRTNLRPSSLDPDAYILKPKDRFFLIRENGSFLKFLK